MSNNKSVPHFLIIGAAKSGTTTLYDDLKTSKALNLPYDKEPAILIEARSRSDAIKKYNIHFNSSTKSDTIRGEASTYYMMQPLFPDVSKFALDVCGSELKIIAILRHPVDRIISHVTHDYMVGRLKYRDVDRALEKDSKYLDSSNYYMQLKTWVDTFGLKNLSCISFKEYITNRRSMSQKVAEFVGIDPNSLDYREEISNASFELRRNILSPEIMKLYYRHIRKYTPTYLRKTGVNLFTKNPDLGRLIFSQSLKDELIVHFSKLEPKLSDLLGTKIDWEI